MDTQVTKRKELKKKHLDPSLRPMVDPSAVIIGHGGLPQRKGRAEESKLGSNEHMTSR